MGSERVPEMWDLGEYQKCGIRASIGKGRILVSTRKVEIRASTRNGGSGRVPEMWDPGEYREGNIRVSTEKGRIRASIGEGKIRVSIGKGRIRASTKNVGSGRVSKMWDPGEHREGKIRTSTGNVRSGQVPGR